MRHVALTLDRVCRNAPENCPPHHLRTGSGDGTARLGSRSKGEAVTRVNKTQKEPYTPCWLHVDRVRFGGEIDSQCKGARKNNNEHK